ncbi:MAG: RICIN domain-containing protein [Akkermansiaceae bacterium]|nr:RICIN domain-containing protein [Akkermansiaceae bacterium]
MLRPETQKTPLRYSVALLLFTLASAFPSPAQDRDVVFETTDPGEAKSIATWGLDTAWLSEVNVRRGVVFMGQPQVDVIRFSFTGDWPLVGGTLGTEAQAEFDQRMAIVDNWTESDTALYFNNDTGTLDSSFDNGDGGVNAAAWAELIDVTRQKCEDAGRKVLSVSPMNEPDYATWQGDVNRFGDVCWQLRNTYGADFAGIRLMGGNTLNNDQAAAWYDTLNGFGYLEEGNTHQLAGSFDTYAAFYDTVQANGDVGCNDELHNVAEAMIGAEHGMDAAIWWGSAERARGEFVQASDGDRLAYAENRPYWTAASVYRAPGAGNALKGFVGESERQSVAHNYQFIAKDRPVFFDGHGPQHTYELSTSGDWSYWSTAHKNAERVVNITWGDDVQPAIDGTYILVNRHSHLAMETTGTADGDNIQQGSPSGSTLQQWNISPLPLDSGGDYSYFSVTNVNSGRAPDTYNFSLDPGGDIRQWGLPGTYPGVNQQWYFEYVEDGWFRIRSRWSGHYLCVASDSTSTGANILQWTNTGHNSQQWRLLPVGAAVEFTAPATPSGLAATAQDVSIGLNWNAVGASDLAGYTILRSATTGGPYDTIARGVTGTTYVDSSANQTLPYFYVIRAEDESLNRSGLSAEVSATPTGAAGLVAGYDFDGDLNDNTVNANDGAAQGAVTYGTGKAGGNSCVLDGSGAHVNLPSSIANYDQMTIATWVYWDGGNAWQRIFDFGNGTSEYLYLSPSSGNGTLRFAINGGTGEEGIETTALTAGQWTHVAVTLNGATGILYVNGAQAATHTGMTTAPSDIAPVANYIGRSQYSADPTFAGRLDDFRIYNHALNPTEIAALANVVTDGIPPSAPIGIAATASSGTVNLDWNDNTEPDFDSYTVYRSTVNGSGYAAIASSVGSSAFTDTSVLNGHTYYYVVTASDISSNESAQSAQASATPSAPAGAAYPIAETTAVGTVSGSMANTTASDNVYETLTEIESGGRTSRRYSYLGHTWTFDIGGGGNPVLHVEAHHTANTEGDDFVFVYSTDGVNYTDAITVTKTTDDDTAQTYALPTEITGTVYVRVQDTDRTQGRRALDSLFVDELFIFTDSGDPLLTGFSIGSGGSWGNDPTTTRDAALDLDLQTYYDAVNATGDWVGLDLLTPHLISAIRFAPRPGWAGRMTNGLFQASDTPDFSSGVVTLHTVAGTPTEGVYTTVAISETNAYRYVRYIGPTDGYCNVAEILFQGFEPDTIAPAAPTGLTASPGTSSIHLAWVENEEPDLASYTVYRSTTSGGGYAPIASGVATNEYTDNSAEIGTHYSYVVTATDGSSNESSYSSEVWGIRRETIALTNADFDLGVTNFPGFDSANDVPGWTDLHPGAVIDAGVGAPGDWWGPYDQYAAFMATGDGASNLSGHTIQAGDQFHIGFFAMWWNWTGAAGQWKVTLYYDNPANVIGTYTSPSLTGAWASYANDNAITATPASVGGTLGIVLESIGGGIAQIDEVTLSVITAPDTTPPAAPTGLAATPGNGSVSLTWDENSESDLAGYTVFRSVDGGPYSELAPGITALTYTDESVTNGTTYSYKLSAIDGHGNESDQSAEASAVPDSPPVTQEEIRSVQISIAPVSGGNPTATVTIPVSVVGHSYTIEFNTDLTGEWTVIGTPHAGTGGEIVIEPPANSSSPRGFYRVRINR